VRTSLPGRYVTMQMLMPDGIHKPRQYSLPRADDGEHRQFAVKRVRGNGTPDGEVSNLLHDTVEVGASASRPWPECCLICRNAGTMDLAQVDLPAGAAYYLCGPLPALDANHRARVSSSVV
jgi:ferredoxin-NADP reductase